MVFFLGGGAAFFRNKHFMKDTNARWQSGVRTQDPLYGRKPTFQSANPRSRVLFAEAFAGIDGFRLGLVPLGREAVWASEICKAAVNTYTTHFGSVRGCMHRF